MQKSKWILIIFVLMVLAQWLVPAQMIYGSNEVLKSGVAMKFKCAPVDPNDPFRGKFIVLDFDIARYKINGTHDFIIGQEVYLDLGEDSHGFAQIEKMHTTPPSANNVFLRAVIDYISYETELKGYDENNKIYEISFDLPFRRFYLEETKAPRAEDLYREGMSDTTGNTYGLVYLLKGEARIKDVFIRDTSIYELLKK